MPFINLHNQTYYSLLDSLIEPKDLLARAKELGQEAVAITDHATLASAWEALKVSKELGIKLIIGCEFYFKEDLNSTEKFKHIILLAKNAIGYSNVLTLNKLGFANTPSNTKKVYSIIDWDLLEKHTEGVICLTACGNGIISQHLMNKNFEKAEENLLRLKKLFGENLAVEVQANNMKRFANFYNEEIDQQFLNKKLIDLGKKYDIKIVPTSNTHYLYKEDADVHDTLLAIGSHQPKHSGFRIKYPLPEFYLKSKEEVVKFFSRNYGEEFAEQICQNTKCFSDLCENPEWIDPKFSNASGKELPEFPVKDEEDYQEFLIWLENQSDKIKFLDEDKAFLRYKCDLFFAEKTKHVLPENIQKYKDRLEEELYVLEHHGFSSYMLIVADFLNWCVKNDIEIGCGRGSVGGSLIGYVLDIHKADPIKYDLIFARFHNIEKKSFPDIDSDVSTNSRGKVLEYLKNKYGENNFCSISNYNTITPKVYLRDLARALELGGSREEAVKIGNDLASFVSNDLGRYTDIRKIFDRAPLLEEYSKKYVEIKTHGAILGLPRAGSSHAAGVIIAKRSLEGLAPLRRDKEGNFVIEYDKDLSEENGFVKMDVLGLSTLDTIASVIKEIKKSGKPFNNEHLDYDANDPKTYELITKGDTFGVFQFGTSGGTIDLCKRVKPKNLEDLAIITTLARPAAAEIRSEFIECREGKKSVELLHPFLNGAFKKTFGFGLFDESILQLGRDVAGWDFNSADRIRKMIKDKGKNPEKDKKLREEFIRDSIKNGVNEILAPRIWDEEVKKFAGYTFNKSHAILYSMISYQTAYLKAHFPTEFLLASLMAEVRSNTPMAKENIEKIKKELRALKIKIMPPDLNHSQFTYTLNDNKLLTGLDALKFVGDDAVLDILEKRPFVSFLDFMWRVDSRKVRANSIQALASAGALDSFKIPRRYIYQYVSDYRKKLSVWMKKHDPKKEEFIYPYPKEKDWTIPELYALEHYYLNEGFICKPADAYLDFFKESGETVSKIKKMKDRERVQFKGIIRDLFVFKVKKEGSKFFGQDMAKVSFEDKNGEMIKCTIFPDKWKIIVEKMKTFKVEFSPGLALNFLASVNFYEDEVGLILETVSGMAKIPPLPKDIKIKKQVSMKKEPKEKKVKDSLDKKEATYEDLLFEEIEDDLINEGLLDIEEIEID